MRRPKLQRRQRGLQSSKSHLLKAPTGGINALSSESSMIETDALEMTNYIPGTSDVYLRAGCAESLTYNSALPRYVTIMSYASPSGEMLIGGSPTQLGKALPDVAPYPALSHTGMVFVSVNFTVPGGNYLIIASPRTGDAVTFNGTVFAALAVTGVLASALSFVTSFKNRLWFLQRDSMSAWYLPVSQIGGAALEFPLGQIFRKGGKVVACASWTLDGGAGIDDLLVFLTDNGELAVYRGTDPSNAATFALVGVYSVSRPLGFNPLTKFGGDLLILTVEGLFPLSKVVGATAAQKSDAITNRIAPLFMEAAKLYGTYALWSVTLYNEEGLLIVNVPTSDNLVSGHAYPTCTLSFQYVMNLQTGAWCKFSGWDLGHLAVYQRELYGAGCYMVYKLLVGTIDINPNYLVSQRTSYPITGEVHQAYSYLGGGANKQIKLVKMLTSSEDKVSIGLGVSVDFKRTYAFEYENNTAGGAALWDLAVWDTGTWGATTQVEATWRSIAAYEATAFSLHIRTETASSGLRWSASTILYSVNGLL